LRKKKNRKKRRKKKRKGREGKGRRREEEGKRTSVLVLSLFQIIKLRVDLGNTLADLLSLLVLGIQLGLELLN